MSGKTERDRPWMFRTYAGHSTAKASNELYRKNLAKGQTGLSIAFDLPTQTGYDPDSMPARGEVGKVGVPVSHLGDMRTLLEGIPLGEMNTSMTINATAAWLLSLYVSLADEQGVDRTTLTGTVQNDIIKEYLSRGTYVFPPDPSLRLIKDVIVFTNRELPKWNPTNVCSYHLQEAGATPGTGTRLRAGDSPGRARRGKGLGRGARREVSTGRGRHEFLRQCRCAPYHRGLEDARLRRSVGRDHARALRRRRAEASPVPLRGSGELARPYRAAAGKQRVPHSAVYACGHAVEESACPRRAITGLERSAGPAAPMGPAMVAAASADRGL